MKNKIIDMLYRSFDAPLSDAERRELEEALRASPELRAEKTRIEVMRRGLASMASRSFEPGFSERVMARIGVEISGETAAERFFESLSYLFRRVALAGAIVIVALVVINLKSAENMTVESALGRTEISMVDLMDSSLDFTLEQSQ